MTAVKNGLCFSHLQMAFSDREEAFERASDPVLEIGYQPQIFLLPSCEIERRIKCLTKKQLEALEYLAGGETYQSAGLILGIDSGTFTNRVSVAVRRAGVKTRMQLICLYALWRSGKAGANTG